MAHFQAYLKLNRPEKNNPAGVFKGRYELLHCDYSFVKEMGKNGEVQSGVRGGILHVALNSFPTDELFAWVFDNRRFINGEVTMREEIEERSEDKICFEQARCVSFRLHYEQGDSLNVILLLTIHAQVLKMGNTDFDNTYR